MAIKKNSTPFYLNPRFLIIYSLIVTALLLLCFLFQKPKPVASTLSKKEQVAKIEIGKGSVHVAPNGGIELLGEGIKLELDTTNFLSITKYREPEWIVRLDYQIVQPGIDLGVYKRVIGPVFAGGSIGAKMDLSEFRASVGLACTF